jgi:hypothetical protein
MRESKRAGAVEKHLGFIAMAIVNRDDAGFDVIDRQLGDMRRHAEPTASALTAATDGTRGHGCRQFYR